MLMDRVVTAIERVIDDGLDSESETQVETETKQEQSISSNQKLNVETEHSEEICVGDLVTISDCLGHWLWASAFTVQATESNLVALEVVDELIEMSRLEKF